MPSSSLRESPLAPIAPLGKPGDGAPRLALPAAAEGARAALPRRRRAAADRAFFTAMIVLIALTAFVGFAHSYYLAGVVLAPLKSRVLHVHAVVFTGWLVILVVQASLSATGRLDLHRKLGMAAFVWACLVVLFGVWAAGDAVARHGADDDSALVPLTDIGLFAVLTALAFRARRDPATHKRLILLGSTAMLTPALFRVPLPLLYHDLVGAVLATEAFALALVAYDLVSLRRIERATWAGTAAIVLVHWGRLPLEGTGAWHAVDVWLARVF